eukprot:PDM81251.1 hypothetical protein PRIPAC_36254 [Pristionchus pacificus]
MENSLSALIDYGSDDEGSEERDDHSKTIVSTEEVYAQDGEDNNEINEPIAKKSRLEGKGIDSAVDSFLAEIGDDLEKISDNKAKSTGEEIIPSVIQPSVEEKSGVTSVEAEKEEPDVKIPFFKLANRCAIAMKSTLNVRSVQMEEYGGFRVYLRYDDIPICLLSSMGQSPSEVTARRSAVKVLVEQMIELGLFPPNVKTILAHKITTVDKIIEVTKPVLSYLKFQLSDQRYQRMLRDDQKMSLKADCTKIQLELIGVLIEQIKFFTYRFYAEPTNNPWLHLAPVNSVAPSVYTSLNTGEGKGVSSSSLYPDINGAPLRINVPKHDVISEIVEKTIGALGWTERNDTIMVGLTRKRAYLWVDEVPIALLGSMGESEKLSEAVSSCTHELMEQLCAWSLFPLDIVSQICRNKDHLNALLFSMSDAFSFISSTVRETQYISLHRTQGMARIPLEAPAPHQAVAISFRCRVKSFMDKFWETHTIHLGPLIPLPKLEQWERVYFVHTESMSDMNASRCEEEITPVKESIDFPSVEKEGDNFISRAAFEGISASLFGATGKGDTKEYAQSMARRNLAGVFAGSMLHSGLLKEFKNYKGLMRGPLYDLCKPIFDNAMAVLGRAEYSCLVDSSRILAIHTEKELTCARAARKEIFNYARKIFNDYDKNVGGGGNTWNEDGDPSIQLLPPPPPPPNDKKSTSGKRTIDEASSSTSLPPFKKMREIVQVIEDDDDDCIVMGSSSESSDGIDDVTEVIYNWKMSVRMNLLEVAQKAFPDYSVNMFAVGSTINGCGSYNSDMDLCLVVYNRDGSITEGQDFAKRHLNKVFYELKKNRNIISKCQFIRHAVVPIIKMETVAPNSLEVDINMNNIAGVYNSHLMHYYSRVDDRFPALCLIIKHWAINAGVNDSLSGTFNSYSLILLVLHYLQCGVVPAILPNLQYLFPGRFAERPELGDLNLFGEFSPPLPQRILNEQSIGEILIGFFQYYSRFDFVKDAISIRKGMTFPRSQLGQDTMKFPLYIEEPFDGKNTARCVRREYMGPIRSAFKHGAEAFNERPPSLDDIHMGEDSDIEMILEDEVNEEEEIVILENKKGEGKKIPPMLNGGINDGYWNKCRQLFHPTMGIDGMLSVDDTIKASIALLFEVDDFIYYGSLFLRLQSAVATGSSVLTREHLGNNTKRTAYYALTTMHGYGLFPRGFVYLSINLLGSNRTKIRKAIEPLKRLNHTMKCHLTYISKCSEKRVSKNKELHDKCVTMQETIDKHSLWQYQRMFEGINMEWPEFVKTAIRDESKEMGNIPKEEWEKMKEEKLLIERQEKLKGKMATVQLTPFWISNTKVWGLNTEVDGMKILERYAVFPKGIVTLIIKSIIEEESVLNPIIDLLGKMAKRVEENINHMLSLAPQYSNGKTAEKDPQIAQTLNQLRSMAKDEIYPHLPSVFSHLKCTRVPIFVAEWMKKSPMTKSSISHWSSQMGMETDLNGFPLKMNEEFIAPQMTDEYLVDDEQKAKTIEKKDKKRRDRTKKGEMKEEKEEDKEKDEKIEKKNKKTDEIILPTVKIDIKGRRKGTAIAANIKPVSLLDQVISNPFGYPRMIPPPGIPPPFETMNGLPFPFHGIGGMGPSPPPFMACPPPSFPPHFSTSSRIPGLLDIPLQGIDNQMGVHSHSFMGMGQPPPTDFTDYSHIPPPSFISPIENEEKRKLEKMARLMMGSGEEKEEEEKKVIRDDEEMNERERRLQKWLEEKNGERRKDREERREERRDEKRKRSRSRSRERERDGRGDFERRVEELERRKKEEKEEKERNLKEYCVEHWRRVKGSFKPMDESKWEFRPKWGVTTVWRRVSGHSKWEDKVQDKLDILTVKMKEHFVNNVQTTEDEERKKIVMERLRDGIQMRLDGTGVFFLMAGSSPSSFASRNSNLDLVLISPVPSMTSDHIRDFFFPELPFVIMQRGGKITRQESLWMEFECTMGGSELGVRIAIDSGAYYFSKIMCIYDNIDKRVAALLHYIKHWTATHLRRADDISKYLLTNLVIHYLQSGVSPPILPCLHLLYPARLTPDVFSSFDYASPFDPPLPECSNTQSLASLFIGFLMYYASFDFSRYAISIRSGTVIRKTPSCKCKTISLLGDPSPREPRLPAPSSKAESAELRDLAGVVPEFAVEHPFDGSYSAVVNDPFTSSHFTAAMTAACQDAITTLHI